MDELESCPLHCNLEQLRKRLDNLSVGIAGMGEKETIQANKAFLLNVLNYMQELFELRRKGYSLRAAPENKALTREQLRKMDGEPVWIQDLIHNALSRWIVIGGADANAIFSTSGGTFLTFVYGETWLAYAHKPEKSSKLIADDLVKNHVPDSVWRPLTQEK